MTLSSDRNKVSKVELVKSQNLTIDG